MKYQDFLEKTSTTDFNLSAVNFLFCYDNYILAKVTDYINCFFPDCIWVSILSEKDVPDIEAGKIYIFKFETTSDLSSQLKKKFKKPQSLDFVVDTSAKKKHYIEYSVSKIEIKFDPEALEIVYNSDLRIWQIDNLVLFLKYSGFKTITKELIKVIFEKRNFNYGIKDFLESLVSSNLEKSLILYNFKKIMELYGNNLDKLFFEMQEILVGIIKYKNQLDNTVPKTEAITVVQRKYKYAVEYLHKKLDSNKILALLRNIYVARNSEFSREIVFQKLLMR